MFSLLSDFFFFFFNDTATTEIYTLSLHDALPIFDIDERTYTMDPEKLRSYLETECKREDRKSTRLNSSHDQISYAVFCLKKKKKKDRTVSTVNRYDQQLKAS